MRKRRVVVVGAGIAGLGAAWQLSQRGIAVTVLEREQRAGGRISTLHEDGYAFDIGNPLLSTADRRMQAFIDELGLRDELLPLRPVRIAQVRGRHVSEIELRRPLAALRIPGVKKRQALSLVRLPRLIARYGAALDPDAPERSADLDDRSLGDFGRLYFGRSVLSRWMAPLVTGVTLGDENEMSRALFLRRYQHERAGCAALPRAGLDELPTAAALRLGTRFGVEVRRIDGSPGAPLRLVLEEKGGGGGRQISRECDAVVVATGAAEAFRIASPVLAPAERDALGRIRVTPALVLFLALRRPFHSHCRLVRVPHDEQSPIESVLLEPGARGARAPEGRGLATVRATGAFSEASQELPAEVVEKEILDAFEWFQPGVRNAIESMRLVRVEDAATQFGVGHYREIARLERVADDLHQQGRRVYLAGDYLMGPTWEDALASGHRAARRIGSE